MGNYVVGIGNFDERGRLVIRRYDIFNNILEFYVVVITKILDFMTFLINKCCFFVLIMVLYI